MADGHAPLPTEIADVETARAVLRQQKRARARAVAFDRRDRERAILQAQFQRRLWAVKANQNKRSKRNRDRAEARTHREAWMLVRLATDPSVAAFRDLLPSRRADLLVEAIEAIPIELRRYAFGLAMVDDPFYPLLEQLARVSGNGLSLRVIGWVYGISKQRVEQVEVRGCTRMRNAMSEWR